ncbi:hypothetical protein [Micromonospora echinofusca]|uniref:Uncharacterized protein n=1 Tax=Micromonospora echinofusca TaxID=47858 RepID=A0ABS3VVX3_MICEH|nr:hypothetical protein [Micromonospora echinofusca]MBO4208658.1 hypothetical protein [Micromonospora echinofusca]
MSDKSAQPVDQITDQPAPTEAELGEAGAALVPATVSGMPPTAQVFFAVVESTGVLVRGFGAVATLRLGVGTYQVTFSHDMTRSAFVATTGFTGSVGAPPDGRVTVVGRAGVPNAAFVQTRDGAGNLADRAFHMVAAS